MQHKRCVIQLTRPTAVGSTELTTNTVVCIAEICVKTTDQAYCCVRWMNPCQTAFCGMQRRDLCPLLYAVQWYVIQQIRSTAVCSADICVRWLARLTAVCTAEICQIANQGLHWHVVHVIQLTWPTIVCIAEICQTTMPTVVCGGEICQIADHVCPLLSVVERSVSESLPCMPTVVYSGEICVRELTMYAHCCL